MVDATRLPKIQPKVILPWALALSVLFVLVLCIFFNPRWETNDDVAMSMAAHGYGIAAISSPNLIFSNVIWGYLVQSIPQINGVLGYSIATLCVLITIGTVISWGMCRIGLGIIGAISLLALVLSRPVLFPQFTINAGLLMVGAIICWHLYGQHDDRRFLLAACLLSYFSYLIRSHEFLLVLLIALPLLPWRKLIRVRVGRVATLVLVLAVGISTVADYQAYQDDKWKAFKGLNLIRAAFTDFRAGIYLKQHPEILVNHGYSSNDIDLIGSWFFVDPNIANPQSLKAMLADLGQFPDQKNAIINAWAGIMAFIHPTLLPGVLAALFLMCLLPNRKLLAVWILSFAAFIVLGLLGRPGVLRVYIPAVSLLVIAPLLVQSTRPHSIWRWRLVSTLLLPLTAFFNTAAVFSESRTVQMSSEQIQRNLQNFPSNPVVIWGAVFPFEAAYPVLKQSHSAMSYQLYGLGVFTLAPFSRAHAEQKLGQGLINRLLSQNGIPIIANEQCFGFLATYCQEHFGGILREHANQRYGQVSVSQRRCDTGTSS